MENQFAKSREFRGDHISAHYMVQESMSIEGKTVKDYLGLGPTTTSTSTTSTTSTSTTSTSTTVTTSSTTAGPTTSSTTTTATPVPTEWNVIDRAGNPRIAKGIRLQPGATAGNIRVHLVEDYNADGSEAYTTYQFAAIAADRLPYREGFIFDKILADGTTIDLTYVKILL